MYRNVSYPINNKIIVLTDNLWLIINLYKDGIKKRDDFKSVSFHEV